MLLARSQHTRSRTVSPEAQVVLQSPGGRPLSRRCPQHGSRLHPITKRGRGGAGGYGSARLGPVFAASAAPRHPPAFCSAWLHRSRLSGPETSTRGAGALQEPPPGPCPLRCWVAAGQGREMGWWKPWRTLGRRRSVTELTQIVSPALPGHR